LRRKNATFQQKKRHDAIPVVPFHFWRLFG